MRVVVVSAWEPWRLTDGDIWILHHHLRSLAGRHDITVLAAGAPATESPPPPEAQTVPGSVSLRWFGTDRSASTDYAARWLTARRTHEPIHVPYVERPALLAALREEISRAGADVVHAFGWGTAGLWRHVDGVPVVHTAVDAWHLNAANRRLAGWRRITDAGEARRIRAHEARHYPQVHSVLVVAEPDADSIRSLVPGVRVDVVPNGVDAGPAPVPPPAFPVLGFHGSFEARHNIDAARLLVTEVLPLVRHEVPDAQVLLVGRSPGRDVRQLEGPAVELRADVADVRAELDRMTVYAAPLVSGAGMKNKVLEAMAAGRPVVTTALGTPGIGAGPGLREAADSRAIAAAVIELLRDTAQWQAESSAARARVVADFSWERSARAVEQVWDEAAGSAATGESRGRKTGK